MPVDLENLGRWKERKESEKRLCLHMWQAAWDGYAIAAVALEQAFLLLVALALQICFFSFPHQFQYADALLHKKNVVEVAACAAAEGRTIMLGVLYDEIARQAFLFL